MRKALAVLLCVSLYGCEPTPPTPTPTPSPSPSGPPTPTPPPTPPPLPGYDCNNQPTLSGLVEVKDGAEGEYTVVLKSNRVSSSSVRALASRFGVANAKYFRRGFSGKVTAARAKEIASHPQVQFVHKSVRMKKNLSYGLDMIDGRSIQLDGRYEPGSTGTGVHVVVVDTYLDTTHSDFQGRVGESYVPFGRDSNLHATHVAGTVLGTEWGVAKQATLHSAQVLDSSGSGTDATVAQGIDFAVGLRERNGWPVVINMSLGGGASPALDRSTCDAIQAGVVVVVAAGNDFGSDACDGSPSRVAQALTVAASDRRAEAANFSNQGRCVDIWAPGVDIESARAGGGSTTMMGTSMSAPHVAGVAALHLERNLGATPEEVSQGILRVATRNLIRGVFGNTPNLFLYAKAE